MNLRVNFLVLILFMELVSQLHTYGIVYFATLNTFFSSPLRTYFYDINFRSPFKQSHRIPQIPYFPNMSNFSSRRDPLTYIVVHILHAYFSLSPLFCDVLLFGLFEGPTAKFPDKSHLEAYF